MERTGEPIPGSRYYRAFCVCCGEPIRVSLNVDGGVTPARCWDCRGDTVASTGAHMLHAATPANRSPGQRAKLGHTTG